MMERHLTPAQVSEITGMNIGTLSKWRHESKGPPWVRMGGRSVRYPESGLRAWMNEQEGAAA